MEFIRKKGFRIFLYLFGYISCAAVIALACITAMRYTSFQADIGTAAAYAETDSVKYQVAGMLYDMQTEVQGKAAWEESGLEAKKIDLFDYTNEKEETVALSDLAKEQGYTDVLSALSDAGYYREGTMYADEYMVPEVQNSLAALQGGSLLKIRRSDYFDLLWEHSTVYSEEHMMELQDTLGTDYAISMSKEAEEEYALYLKLSRGGYTADIYDGSWILLLDSGVLAYSPESGSLRLFDDRANVVREFYLDGLGSSDLYIAVPADLSKMNLGSGSEDEAFLQAVFSGSIYSSPFEAVYALMSDRERSLVLDTKSVPQFSYIYANTAYSFGDGKISGMSINDPRGITDTGNTSAYSGSYQDLAGLIADNADICVRYDKDTGTLTQWYRDPDGNRKDYAYISDLKALTSLSDESFVFGVNLYESWSNTFLVENIAFTLCAAVPSPALWLILSAIVFLLCVALILTGTEAKLLSFDRIPFEIVLAGYLILVFCLAWILPHETGRNFFMILRKDIPGAAAIVLALILALYLLTAALFTTTARRIKCRSFLKSLLTVKLVKLILRGLRILAGKTARGCKKIARNYENALSGQKRFIVFCSILLAVTVLALLFFGLFTGHAALIGLGIILIAAEIFAAYRLLKYSAGVQKVLAVSRRIEGGDLEAKTDTSELRYNVKELGESLNSLGDGLQRAVESSIRDERTKAELITNVSHDIKTPLTSIISYVDLLKKEPIGNERAKEYIDVLDKKSQRLKQLIMDLIEVSKTGTGNIELERMNLDLKELLDQALGEYEEKMAANGLEPVVSVRSKRPVICADGRRVFRIIDNILNNVVKYAQPGTRVYIDLREQDPSFADAEGNDGGTVEAGIGRTAGISRSRVIFSVKNVSREMLNISADELTERFVRGDRSRHTEGSGLGLSIARNLTELQDGTFGISIDGDLFKVEISFPAV